MLVKQKTPDLVSDILFYTIEKQHREHYVYHHYSINITELEHPKRLQIQLPVALSLAASCDGLLVFQDKYDPNQLYISNPMAAQIEALPRFPSTISGSGLALVYDALIGKYKVFGVKNLRKFTMLTLQGDWEVYTYRKDKALVGYGMLTQLFLLGKELHWLTINADNDQECYYIYRLHIEKLEFSRTKVPPHWVKPGNNELCEFMLRGRLHLLSEVNRRSLCLTIVAPCQLETFVLDRVSGGEEEEWTKFRPITLKSLSSLPSLVNGFLSDQACIIALKGTNLLDLLKDSYLSRCSVLGL